MLTLVFLLVMLFSITGAMRRAARRRREEELARQARDEPGGGSVLDPPFAGSPRTGEWVDNKNEVLSGRFAGRVDEFSRTTGEELSARGNRRAQCADAQ